MAMYFFDTRDDAVIIRDDVGLEFPDFATVKVQASKSLAELALDVLPGVDRRVLAVDVRDARDHGGDDGGAGVRGASAQALAARRGRRSDR